MHSAAWVSRYADAARQAETYRDGRVLLAGDAAHIHYPAGGQGLNLGIQDAVNLGWKLAAVIRREASDELLDTYHTERFPYAERVLQATRAQTVLGRPGSHSEALRDVFAQLTKVDEVNRYFVGMFTQLDIQYAVGEGSPLLGRRIPDLDLKTDSGDTRVFRGWKPPARCCSTSPRVARPFPPAGPTGSSTSWCQRRTLSGTSQAPARSRLPSVSSCVQTGTWPGWLRTRVISTPCARP
nr:FAD-dependent monooxygenase [Fodinicola feengrottensis]